ncbi:cytochrome b-c1 complex subunit 7-like [Apis mellifera caucasica]|uniref:Cytochrome b-c1 complex subunit 7 n=1 Tax=Apis mellifera TaxID=7460 RepID=A0A7M7GZW5_APIME|nr:cytochrome b-c1 complex subunit 7-like [Apis mellifera]KAG6798955.1 cytochrome b-c1 complex subunit 7-like [Apis mellifera caucasica]KAG9432602.1 cytochrome b-c1 complex subunit 7-like [Apis mellifera carnica]|eukprot:XP_006567377.2 cytochrome b-c1 complex subunit 7-like [Apis mellifera]
MLGTKLRMLAKVTPMVKRPKKPEKKNSWTFMISKFAFNLAGYNKFGLYSDDIIYHDSPVVKEALRRLPKEVLDARNFRSIRAAQLDFLKMNLPKEKWITYEQDINYRYLQPYIIEIVMEKQEVNEFGCTNYAEWHWPSDEFK